MNALDTALEDTVHDYEGGTSKLAEDMGMSRTILNNKACMTNEHHHFHPQQLMQLQKLTNNWSITDAFVAAREASRVQGIDSGRNATGSLFDLAAEFGRLAEKVNEAMSDNVITERERRECLKEVDAMNDKCEALRAALHREGLVKAV